MEVEIPVINEAVTKEGENKNPKDMTTVIDLASPPASKKLKQARLPFKVLSPKSATLQTPPATTNQKKRKLSENHPGPQKLAKTPKKEENTAKCAQKKVVDNADNEVSSSSEADQLLRSKSPVCLGIKPKVVGSLDKFVRTTQQLEVSTSTCSDGEVVVLDDTNNEAEGKEITISKKCEEKIINVEEKENIHTTIEEPSESKSKEQVNTAKAEAEITVNTAKAEAEITVNTAKAEAEITVNTAKAEAEIKVNTAKAEAEIKVDTTIVQTETKTMLKEVQNSPEKKGEVCKPDDASPSTPDKATSTVSSPDTKPSSPAEQISTDGTPKSSNPAGCRKKSPPSSVMKERNKQKDQSKLDKQKQKEEAKTEKEKQRKEEKERKEQERLEAKRKKEEEKQQILEQKQQEREEKLKQKEEERKSKQQEKDEERRKKQEVIDAKNEEKKKKDDEKQKAEDELRLKKEKEKAHFTKFFTKTGKQPIVSKPVNEEKKGMFIAFEVKNDMRLAPMVRVDEETRQEKTQQLDLNINKEKSADLYLNVLKQKKYKRGRATKTWPYECDLEIVPEVSTYHLHAKLIQFHENHRPAYYGTYRKRSEIITPRKPLKKDEVLFDYEVDSDDEWEEEEPGESLSNSEGEGSDDDTEKDPAAEEEDGFFVPHGYLSEGEGCEDDDDDISPERLKAQQLAKAKAWDADMKKKSLEILRPVCIGCLWSDLGESLQRDPNWEKLQQFKGVPLVQTPISLQVATNSQSNSPRGNKANEPKNNKKSHGYKFMPVPDDAIPELIRLLHGNMYGIQKIIKEFREYWCRKSLGLELVNTDDLKDAESSQSENNPANQSGNSTANQSENSTANQSENNTASQPGSSTANQSENNTANQSENNTADQSEAMDTSQEEEKEKSPEDVEKSAESSQALEHCEKAKEFLMSKRQLEARIRKLAVYEKRTPYSRICWYVHKEVLDKYELSDLPIPTKWHWLTRSNIPKVPKKSTKEAGTPTLPSNKTPTARRTPQMASANIKQFAVAGYTPPIPSPSTQPKPAPVSTSAAVLTPNIKQFAVAGYTPPMLTPSTQPKMDKSLPSQSSQSTPKNKQVTMVGTPNRRISTQKSITPSTLFACSPGQGNMLSKICEMARAEGSQSPKVKGQNKNTLMSMFSPPTKPAVTKVTSLATAAPVRSTIPTVAKEVRPVASMSHQKPQVIVRRTKPVIKPGYVTMATHSPRPGDSVDMPMELD